MSTTTSQRIAIIGSGFAGMGAAIKLKEAGFDDITIIERGDSVGGTWRDNHYPGAACDIPAHLYSFSFAPRTDWSTVYPRQPEIRAYLDRLADDFDLRRHIEFDTEIVAATWDEEGACWQLTSRDGRSFTAEVLLGAVGPLSDPAIPNLPGRDRFEGPAFHSAQWDHDVDLDGKRVGVIGTGASSIQFVPHVVDRAAEVTVFQRSAPWVIPRIDRTYSDLEKGLLRQVPGARAFYRWLIYWQKELRFVGFRENSAGMRLMERFASWHMRRAVSDPELRETLTPDYRMGCKRILISSDYYPALARDNTRVVTDPIGEITAGGIRTATGEELDLDVLIYGTGFRVSEMTGDLAITGSQGRDLVEEWGAHPSAYLGTSVPGFPNLFLLLGPNTGLGHNSMIVMMEAQFDYIVGAVERMRDLAAATIEVREDAVEAFVAEIDRRNQRLVWSSGCRSWYLGDDGHNFTLWPGYTFEYRRRTREFSPAAYRITTRERPPGDPEQVPVDVARGPSLFPQRRSG